MDLNCRTAKFPWTLLPLSQEYQPDIIVTMINLFAQPKPWQLESWRSFKAWEQMLELQSSTIHDESPLLSKNYCTARTVWLYRQHTSQHFYSKSVTKTVRFVKTLLTNTRSVLHQAKLYGNFDTGCWKKAHLQWHFNFWIKFPYQISPHLFIIRSYLRLFISVF